MEQKAEVRSLQERVGLSVMPTDLATLVTTLVEVEEAGVDHIWVGSPPRNPDLLTTLAAAMMRTTHLKVGDESKIRDRLLELLSMEVDELTMSLLPISDTASEGKRLARLIGQL